MGINFQSELNMYYQTIPHMTNYQTSNQQLTDTSFLQTNFYDRDTINKLIKENNNIDWKLLF